MQIDTLKKGKQKPAKASKPERKKYKASRIHPAATSRRC
jgi:hypothetical protein